MIVGVQFLEVYTDLRALHRCRRFVGPALLESQWPWPICAGVLPGDRSLLIVEDDKSFLQRLARAMESRGFTVTTAETVAEGLTGSRPPRPPSRSSTCGSMTATAST